MTIAVLAVQGAFAEHEKQLEALGADWIELRRASDLDKPFDGLILPGGESTVQGKLLRELGMLEPLRQKIQQGLPTLGTCAGLILLAQRLEGGEEPHLGTMPITVRRNAYGRQLSSFYTEEELGNLGRIPMEFIRAPYIRDAAPETTVLARVEGRIVAAQYQNQVGVAFHPELCPDTSLHQYLLDLTGGSAPEAPTKRIFLE